MQQRSTCCSIHVCHAAHANCQIQYMLHAVTWHAVHVACSAWHAVPWHAVPWHAVTCHVQEHAMQYMPWGVCPFSVGESARRGAEPMGMAGGGVWALMRVGPDCLAGCSRGMEVQGARVVAPGCRLRVGRVLALMTEPAAPHHEHTSADQPPLPAAAARSPPPPPQSSQWLPSPSPPPPQLWRESPPPQSPPVSSAALPLTPWQSPPRSPPPPPAAPSQSRRYGRPPWHPLPLCL